jgi:hypothetical protein
MRSKFLVILGIAALASSDGVADKVCGVYGDEADEIARTSATVAALNACRGMASPTDDEKAECDQLWRTPEGVQMHEEWKKNREATVPKALRECIDRKPRSDTCVKMIRDDFARMFSESKARLAARPSAKIGMTVEDVRTKTNWGAPQNINTTTTGAGVHEQWVYEGSQYPYFENGILTAIQQESH